MGVYDSPESREKYHALVADLLASRHEQVDVTIDQLAIRFMKFAVGHYLQSESTRQISNVNEQIKKVVRQDVRKRKPRTGGQIRWRKKGGGGGGFVRFILAEDLTTPECVTDPTWADAHVITTDSGDSSSGEDASQPRKRVVGTKAVKVVREDPTGMDWVEGSYGIAARVQGECCGARAAKQKRTVVTAVRGLNNGTKSCVQSML